VEVKRTEKKKVERDVVVEHEIRCDVCQKKASSPTGGVSPESRGPDWENGNFDFDVTLIRRVVGSNYPECGRAESRDYHLCPKCWDAVIVPALEARGVKPQVTETDW
jgi:hypothetical protein